MEQNGFRYVTMMTAEEGTMLFLCAAWALGLIVLPYRYDTVRSLGLDGVVRSLLWLFHVQ